MQFQKPECMLFFFASLTFLCPGERILRTRTPDLPLPYRSKIVNLNIWVWTSPPVSPRPSYNKKIHSCSYTAIEYHCPPSPFNCSFFNPFIYVSFLFPADVWSSFLQLRLVSCYINLLVPIRLLLLTLLAQRQLASDAQPGQKSAIPHTQRNGDMSTGRFRMQPDKYHKLQLPWYCI